MYEPFADLLRKLIRVPSVSTDSAHASDIAAMADLLRNFLKENGFAVEIVEGFANPLVVASLEIDKNLPTCLVYGHYDVQPASPSEGWASDPFELVERDGRLYARGAVDNKGQLAVHLSTVVRLAEAGRLAYNIKLLVEGNEETGSDVLPQFVEQYKEKLAADFILISDGEIPGGKPALDVSFRGGSNATLTITTSDRDLHSGIYGGIAPSSAHELARITASLYTADNVLAFPGAYDGIVDVPESAASDTSFDAEAYKAVTGVHAVVSEPNVNPAVQLGFRPTVQVTGIQTGYVGEGYRNSIPGTARAKLNIRTAPGQDPHAFAEALREHIAAKLPDYASFELDFHQANDGVLVATDSEYFKKAARLLEAVYGTAPKLNYCGASIPIVTDFARILGVPQVLVPLGNDDCNMHGANENFERGHAEKALEFSEKLFSRA